ncbi:hypothetical protein LVY75_34965 (plasmid) [Sinorhizobium sp. B11]
MFWITILSAFAGAWACRKYIARLFTNPRAWAKADLKRQARKAGARTENIPEAAWDELTSRLIVISRSRAWEPMSLFDFGWRGTLLELCAGAARELEEVLRTQEGRSKSDPVFQILLRHNVINRKSVVLELEPYRTGLQGKRRANHR